MKSVLVLVALMMTQVALADVLVWRDGNEDPEGHFPYFGLRDNKH